MALDRAWDGCDGACLNIFVYVCIYIYIAGRDGPRPRMGRLR